MTRTDRRLTRGQGFTFWAPHHFYYGLIILIWAFWDIFAAPPDLAALSEAWIWLRVGVAIWVCLDDVRQHLIQRKNPQAHTLLHNAYWEALGWVRRRVPDGPKWTWLVRLLDWLASV